MQKYRCYGKDDLGYPYDALYERDENGDWYRAEDVDAYRAETGSTIHALQRGYEQQAARIAELEQQVSAMRPNLIAAANATEPYEDRIAELEKALRDLLEDTQHAGHDCGDTLDNCAVLRARALMGFES
jgi:septal ring factor EnvC (AmiA/AmiB activator)